MLLAAACLLLAAGLLLLLLLAAAAAVPSLQPRPIHLRPFACSFAPLPFIRPSTAASSPPACPTPLLPPPHHPCRSTSGTPSGTVTPRAKLRCSCASVEANACHVTCFPLRRRPSPRAVK